MGTHPLTLPYWMTIFPHLDWIGKHLTNPSLGCKSLHPRDYVPKTHFCVFFFAPLNLGVHEEGNSRST